MSCDGEIQEIGRQMSAIKGPAVLFENIEGYTDTWCTKLFVGSLNTWGKVALAIGLPYDTPTVAIIDEIVETLRRDGIPPVILEGADAEAAPVKQNKITGDDINLFDIPVPLWHPQDGGRYINMWQATVTKDPETGAVNVGTYRGMIVDKNTITNLVVGTQHWGQHYEKYRERGEDMPVAFVYGWDPAMILCSGSPQMHPEVWGEWEWLGAIRGEPVPLVKCETVDLYVPASAEIVIEGHVLIDPAAYVQEGPVKDVSGRYSDPQMRPAIKVSCITYRDDPIYVGTVLGIAPVVDETLITYGAGVWAVLKEYLQDMIPGFIDVTISPIPAVKIHKLYQGHAYQVGCALFAHKATDLPWKMWVVVEEDVNIYDASSVMSAIKTNCHPIEDIYIFETQRGILDAAVSAEQNNMAEYGSALTSVMLIDATTNWVRHPRNPLWGGERIAPIEPAPEADFNEVLERWAEYGFGDLARYEKR